MKDRLGDLEVHLSELYKKIDTDYNELILCEILDGFLHGTSEEEILINIQKSINMEFKEEHKQFFLKVRDEVTRQ